MRKISKLKLIVPVSSKFINYNCVGIVRFGVELYRKSLGNNGEGVH